MKWVFPFFSDWHHICNFSAVVYGWRWSLIFEWPGCLFAPSYIKNLLKRYSIELLMQYVLCHLLYCFFTIITIPNNFFRCFKIKYNFVSHTNDTILLLCAILICNLLMIRVRVYRARHGSPPHINHMTSPRMSQRVNIGRLANRLNFCLFFNHSFIFEWISLLIL